MEARLYTAAEAAEIMGVSLKRMRQLMHEDMRCVEVGKRLRVTGDEIVRWQREKSVTHQPAMTLKERRRAEMRRLEEWARIDQELKANGGKIPRRR